MRISKHPLANIMRTELRNKMTANLIPPLQLRLPPCATTIHVSIEQRSRANKSKNLITRMATTVVNGLACLKLL